MIVIVWLNGPFGVGKTSVARELAGRLPDARIFDPETVGYMLRQVLIEPVADFQDLPPWRSLVVQTASRVLAYAGGSLIAPQTVLVEPYAREIFEGLHLSGIEVRHVVLHANSTELTRRIDQDPAYNAAVAKWRRAHMKVYEAALPWLRQCAEVIDTSRLSVAAVAEQLVTSAAGA